MCTILGATGAQLTRQELEAHFAATHTGGRMTRLWSKWVPVGWDSSGWLSWTSLPGGCSPSPWRGTTLCATGEIYGFRALRRSLEGKYPFHSDSDCEVLLPCTGSMAGECSPSWGRSSPWFCTITGRIPFWPPGTPWASVPSTTAPTGSGRRFSPVSPRTWWACARPSPPFPRGTTGRGGASTGTST